MDTHQKKEKLNAIVDEVNEFHPMLQELFNKMPQITHVNHTHGQSELGADFILTVNEPCLNLQEYIGVVVKIGVIKQDNSDVERQIDECTNYDRPIPASNKKDYLNRVWVVSNQIITSNAQEKISQKYRNQNVSFIDQDKLIELIDKHYQEFWEPIPIGISSYIRGEMARCESDNEKYSLLPVDKSAYYIEPDIIRDNKDRKRKLQKSSKREKVNIFDEIERSETLVIQGEMGSGKSRLIRRIFAHYSDSKIFQNKKILPIRITFEKYIRNYKGNSNKLFQDILNNNKSINTKDLDCYLLLIDAVDEFTFDYEKQMDIFDQAISTTLSFFDDKKVISVFTIREVTMAEKHSAIKNIKKYRIRPLDNNKLFSYLCNICNNVIKNDRLIEDLKKSELFKNLPHYPMSAILLASLINEDNVKDIPMNITELYTKYTELALGRWDIKRGLQSEQEYNVAKKFTLLLSKYMYEYNVISIDCNAAYKMYSEYISKRNFDKIDPDILFNKILTRCNIVALTDDNQLIFKHRTFVEYFYALALHNEHKSILDFEVFSPTMHNSIVFYIGIDNDCEELLTQIVNEKPKNDFERFYKPFAISDYFLAGYASPYNVIQNNLPQIFIDLAEYYIDIINKQVVVPFSVLSEAQILWLFELIIRDSYAFSFYKKALDEICYQIEDMKAVSDIVKTLALFFIGCIKLELAIEQPYDFLLQFHEKDLTPAIKYITNLEVTDIAKQSLLLKKFSKKVKHDIENSNYTYRDILTKPIIPSCQIEKKLLEKG